MCNIIRQVHLKQLKGQWNIIFLSVTQRDKARCDSKQAGVVHA